MKPARIEWHLGKNCYGQPLRLVYEKGSGGVAAYTLHRDAGDQRDNHDFVAGLTLENIKTMAQAVLEPAP